MYICLEILDTDDIIRLPPLDIHHHVPHSTITAMASDLAPQTLILQSDSRPIHLEITRQCLVTGDVRFTIIQRSPQWVKKGPGLSGSDILKDILRLTFLESKTCIHNG